MKTYAIDNINLDTHSDKITIACGSQRFEVETINDTSFERLLLMPQTEQPMELVLEQQPDAEGNSVNAIIRFANDPLGIKEGVICSVLPKESVSIKPASMPISRLIQVYEAMNDLGKLAFLERCIPQEERERFITAYAEHHEAKEADLHKIVGRCIRVGVEGNDIYDHERRYEILTRNRTYLIMLSVSEDERPKVGNRVRIEAENIKRTHYEGREVYLGYSEQCRVIRAEETTDAV